MRNRELQFAMRRTLAFMVFIFHRLVITTSLSLPYHNDPRFQDTKNITAPSLIHASTPASRKPKSLSQPHQTKHLITHPPPSTPQRPKPSTPQVPTPTANE